MNYKDEATLYKGLAGCLFLPLYTLGITLFDGALLAKLWGWFMPALFHLPEISIAAAIGIRVIVVFCARPASPPDGQKMTALALAHVIGSLLLLAVGYLAKGFIQ